MLNYKKPGFIKTRVALVAVVSGEPIAIGAKAGVAMGTYAIGESGEYLQGGVVELVKKAGLALVQGTLYGWDATVKEIVAAGDINEDFSLGEADTDVLAGEAVGEILINSTGYSLS